MDEEGSKHGEEGRIQVKKEVDKRKQTAQGKKRNNRDEEGKK